MPNISLVIVPLEAIALPLFDLLNDLQQLARAVPTVRGERAVDLLIFGAPIGRDDLGGGGNRAIVIESYGTIEPVDVLKICGGSVHQNPL